MYLFNKYISKIHIYIFLIFILLKTIHPRKQLRTVQNTALPKLCAHVCITVKHPKLNKSKTEKERESSDNWQCFLEGDISRNRRLEAALTVKTIKYCIFEGPDRREASFSPEVATYCLRFALQAAFLVCQYFQRVQSSQPKKRPVIW